MGFSLDTQKLSVNFCMSYAGRLSISKSQAIVKVFSGNVSGAIGQTGWLNSAIDLVKSRSKWCNNCFYDAD